jgi:photosystem II stability/assembly factor-like uncharacterized protein
VRSQGGSPPDPAREVIPGGVHGAERTRAHEVLDFGRSAPAADPGPYLPPSLAAPDILEAGPRDPADDEPPRLTGDPLDLDAEPEAVPPRGHRSRTLTWGLIAAVAVAVIGTSVASRQSLPAEADQQPDPAPAPSATHLYSGSRLDVIAVRFVNSRRGYALASSCPRGDAGNCRFGFRTTGDGGRSWEFQPVPLPPGVLSAQYPVTMTTAGASGVRISGAGQRWFSPDGGQSWSQPTTLPQDDVETIPAGAPIDARCQLSCGPLRILDPKTGLRHQLRHQPALTVMAGGDPLPQPSDGSRWVAGQSTLGGPPGVAVTRDNGRTWKVAALPVPKTKLTSVAVTTLDGRKGYAFVRGTAPAGTNIKNWLDAIYATADGGATWTKVEPAERPQIQHAPGGQPASVVGAALLTTGRLIVTTEEFGQSNVRYSDDGGRSFPRLTQGTFPELGTIENSGGLLVAKGIFGGYAISPDGTHWQTVRLDSP